MLHVKNILTGEITKVSSLRVVNSQICAYYDFAEPSAKWLAKYPYFVRSEQTILDEQHAVECRVFTLAEGYELTKVKSHRPKPAAAPAPAVADVPAEEPATTEADVVIEEPAIEQPAAPLTLPEYLTEYGEVKDTKQVISEYALEFHVMKKSAIKKELSEKFGADLMPLLFDAIKDEAGDDEDIVKPAHAPAASVPTADALTSAFTALTPLFAGVQKNVTDAVMLTLKPIIDSLKKQAATQVQHIQITNSAGETHQIDEVVCGDFEEMLTYVSEGVPVYMWGAAGCGKSHTARQLADALGLPFYESMQVMFAHDVKGYGDAGGNYQSTPFFKAFTEGGVFFLDEVDASAPEALVVLNTAIANRRFDFPIVGNVTAHPNFRVIAAGNTAMTGADVEYVARSVQDAATENRFSFFEMKYDRRVELPVCAHGDEVLMDFITDLRQAIREANIIKCVSYRQTTLLANQALLKFGRVNALRRNVFKGMEADEIRIIYGYLNDTQNIWAQAMSQLFDSI